MRILVDGLDMSGKTTLVTNLVGAFESLGHPAARHRGFLAGHHPVKKALKRLRLVRQPDSALITTAYLLGGYAVDAALVRLDPPQPTGAILVQDGYVDRTVAFGMSGGPYLSAALALRCAHLFAPFDLAVYLHAPVETRAERMAGREKVDAVDRRSVEDPAFAHRFNAFLLHGMGRRHRNLLVFDTSEHSPEHMAEIVVAAALGAESVRASEFGRIA
nr:hypothetical protein [Kitasatospora sp. MBT66]